MKNWKWYHWTLVAALAAVSVWANYAKADLWEWATLPVKKDPYVFKLQLDDSTQVVCVLGNLTPENQELAGTVLDCAPVDDVTWIKCQGMPDTGLLLCEDSLYRHATDPTAYLQIVPIQVQ